MAKPYFILPTFIVPSSRSEIVLLLEPELLLQLGPNHQLGLGLESVPELELGRVLAVSQPERLLPLVGGVGVGWQACFRMRVSLVCVFV